MSAPPSDGFPAPLSGAAYRQGSSHRHAARILRAADGRVLQLVDRDTGAVLVRCDQGVARREARLGNLPAALTLDDGWRFETADHAGLDRLLPVPNRLHRLEAFRPRLLAVLSLLALITVLVWNWGLALAVHLAMAATPAALPRAIDESNLTLLDGTLAEPSDLSPEARELVESVFVRLLAAADAPAEGPDRSDYRLLLRDIPGIGPNALAMPGGSIIVTDALVEEFPDADILAGVLAHEIAHIRDGHVLEGLYRRVGIHLLVALALGGTGSGEDWLASAVGSGEALLTLAHSREMEREADRHGVDLAGQAGFDPAGLARLFESLSPDPAGTDSAWWSTHPAPAERIDSIRRLDATGDTSDDG